MDVTTFDARITRESTDSMRNLLGTSLAGTDASTFAEHLQPREPLARWSATAESSPPPTSTDHDASDDRSLSSVDMSSEKSDEATVDDVVTKEPTEPENTSQDEASSETDADDVAAVAAASAVQQSETPTAIQPPEATASTELADPATTAADDAPQATATADGPNSGPNSGLTNGLTDTPAKIGSTTTTDPIADSIRGDTDETSRSLDTSVPTVTTTPTGTPQTAATVAAVQTSLVAAAATSPDAASGGANTESSEKSSASAKTRGGKAAAKSNAAGTKTNPGESTAGDESGPKAEHTSDPNVSPLNPTLDALPSEVAGDRSSQNSTVAAVAAEADVSPDANPRAQSLTERLPEQIFGKSSATSGSSDELSSVDQMRLIQRVARAIEVAPQNGGLLRLRLRPPELGAVRLEVALRRGKMTARIETETTQARNVLLDQLPQLRERLEGQGIHVERFDVEVGPRDQGDTPSNSSHTEETYRSASRENRPKSVDTETNAAVASETRRIISATRVNVVI